MADEKQDRLVWIDLEMTGLDVHRHRIIEIATIITDANLSIIALGPNLAIHQPESVLSQMDDWVKNTHSASGLLDRVRNSPYTEQSAEQETLDFIRQYVGPQEAPLCGNSVWQDRRFLSEQMKKLDAYLHYRLIDVSTIKELAKRWAPQVFAKIQKKSVHLALDDIQESIAELQYYKEHFLKD